MSDFSLMINLYAIVVISAISRYSEWTYTLARYDFFFLIIRTRTPMTRDSTYMPSYPVPVTVSAKQPDYVQD